jgi:hypothetical protein
MTETCHCLWVDKQLLFADVYRQITYPRLADTYSTLVTPGAVIRARQDNPNPEDYIAYTTNRGFFFGNFLQLLFGSPGDY